MRADTQSHKTTWLRAIQRQVNSQNEKRKAKDSPPESAPPARQSTAAPKPPTPSVAPEPEPEPEVISAQVAEAEVDANVAATEEMTEMITRLSMQMERPDPDQMANWEEAVIAETPEDALVTEGGSRASIIAINNIRMSMMMTAPAPSELAEEPVAEVQPEDEEDVTYDTFQGLEIKDDAVVDANDEMTLTAAEYIAPEPEPEPEADIYEAEPELYEPEQPTQPSSKASTSAAREAYEAAARGGLASKFDRPLAKRIVPIVAESHVGSQVIKIETKTKAKKRYI